MPQTISKQADLAALPVGRPTGKRRRLVGNALRRRRKMIAFGWYGGKFVHIGFILPHLPTDAGHFCDVYGGSAAVLINREPAPVETYNDLDSELVNFFAVLRDEPQALIRQIGLTPFSREELVRACQTEPSLPAIERARRFYIRARQTRTGLAQTSSEGRWAHCVLTSRAGMAGAVSRWLGAVEGLPEIAQRLQRVQIENAPALEVIRRYDTPDTLFYLVPVRKCSRSCFFLRKSRSGWRGSGVSANLVSVSSIRNTGNVRTRRSRCGRSARIRRVWN